MGAATTDQVSFDPMTQEVEMQEQIPARSVSLPACRFFPAAGLPLAVLAVRERRKVRESRAPAAHSASQDAAAK